MQGQKLKLAMLVAATVSVMSAVSGVAIAQNPDRQQPQGLKDTDVSRQQPQGLRDADEARQQPQGLKDKDVERQQPQGLKDSK